MPSLRNWNLSSESLFHDGEHVFVAEANHSHEGALHAGKAGNKDKGTEGIVVPCSQMVYCQIYNQGDSRYQFNLSGYQSRSVGFLALEYLDSDDVDDEIGRASCRERV